MKIERKDGSATVRNFNKNYLFCYSRCFFFFHFTLVLRSFFLFCYRSYLAGGRLSYFRTEVAYVLFFFFFPLFSFRHARLIKMKNNEATNSRRELRKRCPYLAFPTNTEMEQYFFLVYIYHCHLKGSLKIRWTWEEMQSLTEPLFRSD